MFQNNPTKRSFMNNDYKDICRTSSLRGLDRLNDHSRPSKIHSCASISKLFPVNPLLSNRLSVSVNTSHHSQQNIPLVVNLGFHQLFGSGSWCVVVNRASNSPRWATSGAEDSDVNIPHLSSRTDHTSVDVVVM